MIRNDTVERALHHWEPWLNAVEEARTSLKNSEKETLWSYAGAALRTMRLPTKSSLRVYFLSCVFSSYKRGDTCVFGELRVPPELKGKLFINRSIRQEDDVSSQSPLPPAILTRKDVENLLRDPRYSDIFHRSLDKKEVRKFYTSRFILLNQEHPLRQITSKMKRYVNSDIAVACAKMKESMTYQQLGDKFGWAIQKDAHGKRNRCSTASRYVQLGRKLRST
jgi:hypothetical protein